MQRANRSEGRFRQLGWLIMAVAMMAPAMNMAMGAKSSFVSRPAVAVVEASPVEASPVEASGVRPAGQPSGSTFRLIQKLRGVLFPDLVLADAVVPATGAARVLLCLPWRREIVGTAQRTTGQPHRGPPPTNATDLPHRRPAAHL